MTNNTSPSGSTPDDFDDMLNQSPMDTLRDYVTVYTKAAKGWAVEGDPGLAAFVRGAAAAGRTVLNWIDSLAEAERLAQESAAERASALLSAHDRKLTEPGQMTCLGIVGDIDAGIQCIIRAEMDERASLAISAPEPLAVMLESYVPAVHERFRGRRSALYFLLNVTHAEIDAMLDELWDYTEQWTERNLIDAIAAWRAQREIDSVRDEAEGR